MPESILLLTLAVLVLLAIGLHLARATRQRADWLDGMPEAVLMADRKGHVRYANAQAAALFGHAPAALCRMHLQQLIPHNPGGSGAIWSELFFASHGSERASGSLGLCHGLHKDGHTLTLVINACAFPAQQLVMLLPHKPGTMTPDNPRLHLAEELLRQSSADSGVGHWILHLDTAQLSWSDEVYRIFGVDPDDTPMDFDRYLESVHPEDREHVIIALDRGVQQDQPFDVEYRILRQDGDTRYLLERNHVHKTLDGRIDHLWGTVIDMTDMKRLQQKLHLSQIAVEHCSEGVILADGAHGWTFVNPALCRMTGFSAEQLLARPLTLLSATHQHPLDMAAIEAGMDGQDSWQGEALLPCQDGRLLPVLASLVRVRESGHHVWVMADITRLQKAREALQEMAYHDPLTGLANRTLFSEALDRALASRDNGLLAVAFIDLNGFKQVNDALGHAEGDRLLQVIGQRLKQSLRDTDTVARWGGDEFAVLLPHCRDRNNIVQRVERIREHARLLWEHEHGVLHISASIGVAISPDHGQTAALLLMHADQAMYRAKFYGNDIVCIFAEDLPADNRTRPRKQPL